MNNFNFNEWRQMNEAPFTYFGGQIMSALKGLSFITFVILFCLYLTDKIDCSLWIVTLPLWYVFPVIILMMLLDYIRNFIKKRKK